MKEAIPHYNPAESCPGDFQVIDMNNTDQELLEVRGYARVTIQRVFDGETPVLRISIQADPQEPFIVSRGGNPAAEVKPDGTTGFSMAKQLAAREPSSVILTPTQDPRRMRLIAVEGDQRE